MNWPEAFPYRPSVWFEASLRDPQYLFLHFHVLEDVVCARCGSDKDPVWEDSCVEFFFSPDGGPEYFNIECNCIGKIYMCSGTSREGRTFLPDSTYKAITRESSLGSEPFGLREEKTAWDLRLGIPVGIFPGATDFRELKGRGNFYKCGEPRHYLSWTPVNTEKPDFHRPEFFQEISFR